MGGAVVGEDVEGGGEEEAYDDAGLAKGDGGEIAGTRGRWDHQDCVEREEEVDGAEEVRLYVGWKWSA